MTCASNNTIAALLAGAIDPSAAKRLELHLDGCPACRQLVGELGRGLSAVARPAGAVDRLPRVGDRVGRFEIKRVIGAGGMGVVYEAWDAMLERAVAIKLLRPDLVDATAAQLLAEAQAMARLQHPNIVAVHDVGTAADQRYVCMELVSGRTLRVWLAEKRRTWREIADVFAAAGAGLAYVHRAGLVHLDFKPDNVLIDRDGRVRVTDFGVAQIAGHAPGGVCGTPAYMSPEQRRSARPGARPIDARSDQFAFCMSLQEALAGRYAPGWLRRTIARGLAERPDDRFASIDALLGRLASGMRRTRRFTSVAVVGLTAATFALVLSTLPRPDRIVTRFVDRPIAGRSAASIASVRSAPAALAPRPNVPRVRGDVVAPIASPVASSDRTALIPRPSQEISLVSREPSGPMLSYAVDRSVSAQTPSPTPSLDTPSLDATRAGSALPPPPGPCDDDTTPLCSYLPPACPPGTIVAVHESCWTCAEEQSCAALGIPRTCNDGTRLSCSKQPPRCSGHQVLAVRDGCWQCADPFTCPSRSPAPRRPVWPVCGNGRCERGEDSARCADDCVDHHGGSNGGTPVCGNGFCETGEDHASCESDCCELGSGGSGGCAASCGNGMCESGEDHATCANDCCETTPTGACVPVCGNGFCETGETATSCPSECS